LKSFALKQLFAHREKLSRDDHQFILLTATGKKFTGRSVIIASGRGAQSFNVPREKELIGGE